MVATVVEDEEADVLAEVRTGEESAGEEDEAMDGLLALCVPGGSWAAPVDITLEDQGQDDVAEASTCPGEAGEVKLPEIPVQAPGLSAETLAAFLPGVTSQS